MPEPVPHGARDRESIESIGRSEHKKMSTDHVRCLKSHNAGLEVGRGDSRLYTHCSTSSTQVVRLTYATSEIAVCDTHGVDPWHPLDACDTDMHATPRRYA